jgi:hypothetical protein
MYLAIRQQNPSHARECEALEQLRVAARRRTATEGWCWCSQERLVTVRTAPVKSWPWPERDSAWLVALS